MSSGLKVMVDFILELAWAEVWAGQYLDNNYERITTVLVVS